MPIDFRCAVCKNQIRVPDDSGGKKTKCPKCNAIQRIPDGSAPSQPPPSAGGDFGAGNAGAGQSSDIPGSVSASQGSSSSGLGDDFWSKQSGGPAAPDSNNPFAADPGTPYSTPQQATSPYAPRASSSKEECKGRMMPPAIILMVLTGLGILATIGFSIFFITVLADGEEEAFPFLIGTIVSFFVHLVTMLGLYNAMSMKNKTMAWFGFIMNMIPCGNMCCLIALPFAIWGMVVLADSDVSKNFES
ncbi:MAG: hypothetical protein COA78_12310 [Blastopirellula sp.]|nr:MAG: hypothetical protein COA78_12310 [Blastopirellula sp.]